MALWKGTEGTEQNKVGGVGTKRGILSSTMVSNSQRNKSPSFYPLHQFLNHLCGLLSSYSSFIFSLILQGPPACPDRALPSPSRCCQFQPACSAMQRKDCLSLLIGKEGGNLELDRCPLAVRRKAEASLDVLSWTSFSIPNKVLLQVSQEELQGFFEDLTNWCFQNFVSSSIISR